MEGLKAPTSRYRASVWIGRAVILLLVLAFFQVAPNRWVSGLVLATPTGIVKTYMNWFGPHAGSSSLWYPIWVTVYRAGLGFIIGTALALLFSFFVWRSKTLARILEPVISVINNLPRVALVPIFILWLGSGLAPVLVYVVGAAFFPMFYNIVQGLRSAEREFLESLAILGARDRDVLRLYLIPHVREYFLSGLMISAPLTFVSTIVGEMLMSAGGLGSVLITNQDTFNTNGIYAATLIAGLLGVTIAVSVEHFTKRGRAHVREVGGM
jgi:NitT/TauT family transport system permease protein